MDAVDTGYRTAGAPTVLLVHGAFADTSMWGSVILELRAAGIDALAPANPLRALSADADYLVSVAQEISGPVLLVGHSYGGAVITVAGAQARNAVGLVYVSAYAVAEGESAVDINNRSPVSRLGPALAPTTFSSGGARRAIELHLKREAFREVFGAELPERLTTVLAASQRPITAAALEERAAAAGWRTLPSWYAVATADQVIHPQVQRFMAQRAGAQIVEVDASHGIALSQPAAVAELIRAAATGHTRGGE